MILQIQQNETPGIPAWLQDPISSVAQALPEILAAVLILILGWILGRAIGAVVRRIIDGTEMDQMVLNTPLSRVIGDTERSISRTLGKIAKWFIYLLAFLAAANVLAIPMLSEWISTALTYIPAFVAGLLVILIGFILGDFVGDAISNTRRTTGTRYTNWFGHGVRFFLYFVAVVIGLDTMGIDVTLLYIFARALAWGLAIGLALAIGIGVGWGSRDYVSEHLEEWIRKGREEVDG